MRKIGIILSITALLILTYSCTKENAEEIAPLISSSSMTAKVASTDWSAITRVTKHYSNLDMFVITGTSTDGEILAITVKGDQVGTYSSTTSMDSLNAQVGAVWKPSTSENYVSKSGTVKISEINTNDLKISGTYSFEVVNSTNINDIISITEGQFENLKYSESDSSKVSIY
jgi:hypothetical protein